MYAFVRESLSASAREQPFTLYQPPRTTFPERPPPPSAAPAKRKNPNDNPLMKTHIVAPAGYSRAAPNAGMEGGKGGNESLNQLGLVPQSMLLIKWDDAAMNGECTLPQLSDCICELTGDRLGRARPTHRRTARQGGPPPRACDQGARAQAR